MYTPASLSKLQWLDKMFGNLASREDHVRSTHGTNGQTDAFKQIANAFLHRRVTGRSPMARGVQLPSRYSFQSERAWVSFKRSSLTLSLSAFGSPPGFHPNK